MIEWMAWTLPVAVFFGAIVVMLASMTVWELRSPTVMRMGFLPIATTRGDRLFIGLLAAAYVNLAPSSRSATGWSAGSARGRAVDLVQFRASMALLALIMRKG